jgi:hypothetical protein
LYGKIPGVEQERTSCAGNPFSPIPHQIATSPPAFRGKQANKFAERPFAQENSLLVTSNASAITPA